MINPATAPRTPACHDPSLLFTFPCLSYVAVASPRYQTFPSLSAAYQSCVLSASVPSARRSTSRMTVASTPWMVMVAWVTVTRSLNLSPPSLP